MQSQDFTYWLQGFVEMNSGKQPTKEQWEMITKHLSLVFNPVTQQSLRWPSDWKQPCVDNPILDPIRITC